MFTDLWNKFFSYLWWRRGFLVFGHLNTSNGFVQIGHNQQTDPDFFSEFVTYYCEEIYKEPNVSISALEQLLFDFNQALIAEFPQRCQAYEKTLQSQSLETFRQTQRFQARVLFKGALLKRYLSQLDDTEKLLPFYQAHIFKSHFDECHRNLAQGEERAFLEACFKEGPLDFFTSLRLRRRYFFYYGHFDKFFNHSIEHDPNLIGCCDPEPFKHRQNCYGLFKNGVRFCFHLPYVLSLLVLIIFKLNSGLFPHELIPILGLLSGFCSFYESVHPILSAVLQSGDCSMYLSGILMTARSQGSRRWFQILFSIIFEIGAFLPVVCVLGEAGLFLKCFLICVSFFKILMDYQKYSKSLRQSQAALWEGAYQAEGEDLKNEFQKFVAAYDNPEQLTDVQRKRFNEIILKAHLLRFRWQAHVTAYDADQKKIKYKQKVCVSNMITFVAILLPLCLISEHYLIVAFVAHLLFMLSNLMKMNSRISTILDKKSIVDFKINLEQGSFEMHVLDPKRKHDNSVMALMQERSIIQKIPKLSDSVKSDFLIALKSKKSNRLKLMVIYSAHQCGLFGDVRYRLLGRAHAASNIVQKLVSHPHRIAFYKTIHKKERVDEEKAQLEQYLESIDSQPDQYKACLNEALEDLNKRFYLIRYAIWRKQCDPVALEQFLLSFQANIKQVVSELKELGLEIDLDEELINKLEVEVVGSRRKQKALEEKRIFHKITFLDKFFEGHKNKNKEVVPLFELNKLR